ncbi:MAG: outer membrane lipoprotein-sorting protein [Acidobacteria bacterium]|nr:outer membrane lipoprotein-sorting protein [Acidobacteriota bacterium]
MTKRRWPWLLFPVLTLLSASAFSQSPEEILKKIDRNLTPESFESYRKLINIEPNGRSREYILFTVKKGRDKVASVFLSPASDKGRATLRLGDNMWLYVPDVGKPIRITSLQSVVGGVFNNADILRLDYNVEYGVKELQQKGEEYVLDLQARSSSVAYDRLRMTVTEKTLLPTKIECFAVAGMLIKTLYFKEPKVFEGITRPTVIETDSPLYRGYKSLIVYASIKAKDFPDEVFTLTFLPRVETLR